jgi:RNA recognition motif-containing protein
MGLGAFPVPMFKIYVGNLDPRVKIEHVRELFAPFATIEDAVLVNDSSTGKPKGFAIIMIRDPEIGRAAVKATQGKRLLGKTLTINEVMKKGAAAAKASKEVRQGPFGPHFNRQGGGRAGATRGGPRRGLNRGPRGPGGGPGFGASGPGQGPGSSGGSSFGRPGGFGAGGPGSSGPSQRPFPQRPDEPGPGSSDERA